MFEALEKAYAEAKTKLCDRVGRKQAIAFLVEYDAISRAIVGTPSQTGTRHEVGTAQGAPMSRATAVFTQRPVGQGGFLTGTLEALDEEVNIVYDCGSRNQKELRREIATFQHGPGRRIDILVLSHLDSDHVNGVEALLAKNGAGAVILPYLTPVERVQLAVGEIRSDGYGPDAAERIVSPISWLRNRGARRVYLVARGDHDGSPRLLEPKPPERIHAAQWWELSGVHSTDVAADGAIGSGGVLKLRVLGADLWDVALYAPRIDAKAQLDLERRVCSALERSVNFDAVLREAVWSETLRKRLVSAYDRAIGRAPNDMSLCMCTGPSHPDCWRAVGRQPSRRLNWLSTGDLPLRSAVQIAEFAAGLDPVRLRGVDVFVIPHHGSKHNCDVDELSKLLTPRDWLACAGRSAHHPSPAIRRQITRWHQGSFKKVGLLPRTAFRRAFRTNGLANPGDQNR
ncbi:MBL fold metallo-hydrolase [Sandaracinus amylolyticus]|uniref:MBL fold metallo-hydrolase n=1 Tax=Sandaracinus amylolyticus TaxID=927083 RepID=UPI00147012D3|nr:MBL fold metallo-hydrolase [Sandaracinus amylolyticus]